MSAENFNKLVLGKPGEGMSFTVEGDTPGTYHTMILGSSGGGKSLLSKLSAEQLQALNEWSKSQPSRNGVVDLMAWPGWADVLMSGLEKATAQQDKMLAQDEYHKTGPDSGMLKFDIRTGKFLE